MTWLAAPLGALIGAVLGILGGGGAILTIPILVYVFRLHPHDATSASLVIIGVSSALAAGRHARRGMVEWRTVLVMATVGAIGTYAGSLASAAVDGRVLVVLLAALLVVVAGLMLRHTTPPDAPDAPDSDGSAAGAPAPTPPPPALLQTAALAVGLGALTGFFGVGGGFAIVPALVLVLGFRPALAIGTSLAVIAVNSVSALAARLGQGVTLDWPLVVTFTVAAMLGSLVGEYAGRRLDPARLTTAFAGLLLLVAAYMLVDAIFLR
jgi:uncharacterized membrane protein YfcA